MRAKKITREGNGASSAQEFQDAVMYSYGGIDMDDDTMFGWPRDLGFCGTELFNVRPDLKENDNFLGKLKAPEP